MIHLKIKLTRHFQEEFLPRFKKKFNKTRQEID